jgi:hypothetical protein
MLKNHKSKINHIHDGSYFTFTSFGSKEKAIVTQIMTKIAAPSAADATPPVSPPP